MYDKRFVGHFRAVKHGNETAIVKSSSVPKGQRSIFEPRGGYTVVTLVIGGREYSAKYNTKAGQNFEKKRGVRTATARAYQLYCKEDPTYIEQLKASRAKRRRQTQAQPCVEMAAL